jgi:colanic acid/amylovoran biosynthesis glycosyltransferase
MRILIVAAQFPVLSETFVIEQAISLRRAGADVEVLTLREGDHSLLQSIEPKFKLHTLQRNGQSRLRKLAELLAFPLIAMLSSRGRKALRAAVSASRHGLVPQARQIAQLFGRGPAKPYDAIIAHFGPTGVTANYLREAGLIEGTLATVFHGYDVSMNDVVERYMPHYRRLFESSDLFLPVSEFWAERLVQWGCSRRKIFVGRMGIDVKRFDYRPPAAPADNFELLIVGRLTEKKGIDYAVCAMAMIDAPVKLTIIGGGELFEPLRQLAKSMGVEDRVQFLGKRPHAEITHRLQHAHAFLLPSVTSSTGDMEGIPVALIEAMASGLPVISTRHSGIPELIDNTKTGFLVEERDVGALAHVICAIIRGQFDLPAITLAARETVLRRFNSSIEALRLIDQLRLTSDENCVDLSVPKQRLYSISGSA